MNLCPRVPHRVTQAQVVEHNILRPVSCCFKIHIDNWHYKIISKISHFATIIKILLKENRQDQRQRKILIMISQSICNLKKLQIEGDNK